MQLTDRLKDDILLHAKDCYPRECCGLVVNQSYIPCNNIADKSSEFMIDPLDLVKAEKQGAIQAIVHSHPNGSAKPSIVDRLQMQLHYVPWIIAALPDIDIAIHEPQPYQAPLIGRDYIHGVLDCFAIGRDYYQRELGIAIDDFERIDRWWESADSADLYMDNYLSQGFKLVNTLQRHDVILCRVQPTNFVNHALIYLGNDGSLTSEPTELIIGEHLILHHPYKRTSRREIYGNLWRERTAIILRHESLMS